MGSFPETYIDAKGHTVIYGIIIMTSHFCEKLL